MARLLTTEDTETQRKRMIGLGAQMTHTHTDTVEASVEGNETLVALCRLRVSVSSVFGGRGVGNANG